MTDDLDSIAVRYLAALYLTEFDVDTSVAEFRALLPISIRILGEHHVQTRQIVEQLDWWSRD